jgi:hypothetical protein
MTVAVTKKPGRDIKVVDDGGQSVAFPRPVTPLVIPLSWGVSVTAYIHHPMSEDEWAQMMKVLIVMKPGLVA